jgi:hypothetical protein
VGEIFCTCPDQPWGPPSLLYNGYWVFPGGKKRPGRDADPSPPTSAVGHERVELYLYPPPMGRTACTEHQCLYTGALYLLYLCVTGPGSVVGIATGYGLDGPGIEFRWGRDFPYLSRQTLGSTQPPVQSVPEFSWG